MTVVVVVVVEAGIGAGAYKNRTYEFVVACWVSIHQPELPASWGCQDLSSSIQLYDTRIVTNNDEAEGTIEHKSFRTQ